MWDAALDETGDRVTRFTLIKRRFDQVSSIHSENQPRVQPEFEVYRVELLSVAWLIVSSIVTVS